MTFEISWKSALRVGAAFSIGMLLAWQADSAITAIVWAHFIEAPF